MYTSTAANEASVDAYEQLATDIVNALEAELASTGGLNLYQIAVASKMLPADLMSFLGPDAGAGTFPQHQASITLAQAHQILGGAADWATTPTVAFSVETTPVV